MGNTSPADLARELLRRALDGAPGPESVLDTLLDWAAHSDSERAREGGRALFAGLVEPLADRFEPALCPVYAELFSRAVERVIPELRAEELVAR
ncbi:MAG: hypothetical protein HY822_10185 [Acidobacteria bacterium]|nr:hypothetical protein [Acidobacteriota bacterium]